jgi:hypothetical protein
MQLVFKETIQRGNGGEWARGDIADYPMPTWKQIATSLGQPLAKFTCSVEEAAANGVSRKTREV